MWGKGSEKIVSAGYCKHELPGEISRGHEPLKFPPHSSYSWFLFLDSVDTFCKANIKIRFICVDIWLLEGWKTSQYLGFQYSGGGGGESKI